MNLFRPYNVRKIGREGKRGKEGEKERNASKHWMYLIGKLQCSSFLLPLITRYYFVHLSHQVV
jgi:hypothetical protein